MTSPDRSSPPDDFRHRTLFAALALSGVAILLAAAWALRTLLLTTFLAVILAVILRHLGNAFSRWTGLAPRWSVLVAAGLIVALLAGGATFMGATLIEQTKQLVERVPQAAENLQKRLGDHPWLSAVWARLSEGLSLPEPGDAMGQAGRFLAGLSAALGYTGLALVAALFLALEPGLYRRGFVRLVPVRHRPFAEELLDELEQTSMAWLGGQLVLMGFIGLLVGLGLWAIGVPYALALGVLAGLLEFIPYIGPLLSATPAVLLALTASPTTALWTVLLIFIVQEIENNLLQPLVQKTSVEIPPVLLLVVLFGMGQIFGVAGLIVATPLLAVTLVLVRRIYVERILEGGAAEPSRPEVVVEREGRG